MVDRIKCSISKYQQRLMETSCVPRTSFRRAHFGKDDVNKLFLAQLFIYMDLGIQFLKDVGLIRSKVTCNTCGRDMTWCADHKRDGFRWRCRRLSVVVCFESKSIKLISWFSVLTSLSRRFCFSNTQSCIANLPNVSNKSMASVIIRSRTGASSADRQCSCTWRDALRRSAVLTRPSRSTKASSVSAKTAEATL